MSSTRRITVVLVDDHPIVRDGLQAVLEQSPDFEVLGQAGDGVEAVKVAERTGPDVVVMDVMMPRRDGIDACRDIMDLLPDTCVLMLTASTEEDAVIQAVAAGATGYLPKFSSKEELLTALRDVVEGRLRVPDDTIKRVFAAIQEGSGPVDRRGPDLLNARERNILALFREWQVIRPDRPDQRQQPPDHPQHRLSDSGQIGSQHEAGDRGLGRTEWPPRHVAWPFEAPLHRQVVDAEGVLIRLASPRARAKRAALISR